MIIETHRLTDDVLVRFKHMLGVIRVDFHENEDKEYIVIPEDKEAAASNLLYNIMSNIESDNEITNRS